MLHVILARGGSDAKNRRVLAYALGIMKRLLFTLLVLGQSTAIADLPDQEEYLALHIALASLCPQLVPQRAKRIEAGAAVMLCDMSRGNDMNTRMFKELTSAPSFAPKLRQKEVALKAESPEAWEQECSELEKYPKEGQFCMLPPQAEPRESSSQRASQ